VLREPCFLSADHHDPPVRPGTHAGHDTNWRFTCSLCSPVIGGVLLGRFAPRKIAIAVQIALYVIAVVALTLSAPKHGGDAIDVIPIAVALAAVSAGTLYLGLWLARRSTARQAA
jgi:hypothetical protein